MPTFSRIVAMLVLATFVVSSASAQLLLIPAAEIAPSAGCHGHGSSVPARVPVSHQCCITGHSQAIANNLFSGVAPLPYLGRASQAGVTLLASSSGARPSTVVSSSPGSPGSFSLRI